jgi:hypothetical protein
VAHPIDITNLRFGRLIALERFDRLRWRFRCDCGKEKIAFKANVKDGTTRSCGCLARYLPFPNSTHGHATGGKTSKIYYTWRTMLARCHTPTSGAFADYGGRGIIVCDRWHTFKNFLADMKEPLPGLSLERMDTNGNYEPANCRWATNKDQQRNKRNSKLTIEKAALIRLDTRSLPEIAKTYGVSQSMVRLVKQEKRWA